MATNKWPRLPQRASAESQAHLPLDRRPAATAGLFFPHRDRMPHVDDLIWPDMAALAIIGHSSLCDDSFDEVEDIDRDAIRGSDHAEGIAPIEIDGVAKLLVAYDSPHEDRTDAKSQRLTTDMFDLASARSASAKRRAAGGKGQADR